MNKWIGDGFGAYCIWNVANSLLPFIKQYLILKQTLLILLLFGASFLMAQTSISGRYHVITGAQGVDKLIVFEDLKKKKENINDKVEAAIGAIYLIIFVFVAYILINIAYD